ncbi:putative GIP3 Glc7-interacting protein whose overexpression relocalizes Glc7p from the nucleus [Venustampulla echinocandica]|uniref:Putative GIP3 Glc7-interacting protein whose overexpression relocalizes Glc7p from the nucleus n=1 Tax=Venustampulla echinocandica TaxID=2656787 RepID=A0A370TTR9_9HELO|nr:putative GIP3 Glc7-interacting protein whose overexpression relocalizes Glc7p from the nucleus [Venustampulla echinocandica]RDL38921.1 putative GIP3 Glc7-interacting protein whose overexpression relocalizes Glc7p from the nucleus [Venustampulla echinocandica]
MENVHGVDISWMTSHSSSKDHSPKPHIPPTVSGPQIEKESKLAQNGDGPPHTPSPQKPAPQHRPIFSRSASSERTVALNGSARSQSPSPLPSRRNSWLSSISSKFSSSPPSIHNTHNAEGSPASPQIPPSSPSQETPGLPGPNAPKHAVLQPAAKAPGDAPYTPAPPKSTQPSFLQNALRRLSSGGQLPHGNHGQQHGLCERRVLNVDRNRERCSISELDQSKLRRVAFCVDVEIASGPRYTDDAVDVKHGERRPAKKSSEKGEGVALKLAQPIPVDNQESGIAKARGQKTPKEPETTPSEMSAVSQEEPNPGDKDSKKKEKKKRSEEERKARKEKKRKLAEANGTVPVELVRNASESSLGSSQTGSGTPKTQLSPTTDPVRIYRRCCQLRETPILKKITEQLAASTSGIGTPGVVDKLDLTGYWLQLPDLVTLSDYLAVVPVKDIIMENCGLTDEGVRVLLAGLLAAKCPNHRRSKSEKCKNGDVAQGGFVERVVFKGNIKIGRDGWRYISLFINMCRSLKSMDLSQVPFPQPSPITTPSHNPGNLIHRTTSATSIPDVSCILARALGERLAGREFELLNIAECGLTTEQLGAIIDGAIKSGLRRLGIAGNNITPDGIQHVARFLQHGKCEGLDLGGNDLKEQLDTISRALDNDNELYALSLSDCNLTPESLWALFPVLCKLKNFRFIDLSQNHALFETRPSALPLLRRYLPKMPMLKRIHLAAVSMTPEQAIALAEILPESPNLAHLNIMENPQLATLANAKDEASQEEACALYASLMAAVRVSKTIVCIDIEVPSIDSSEVVKALAKQVVAYCLRNMERGPVAEISEAVAITLEPQGGEREVDIPDVLLHLVGHGEEGDENHDEDDPAPDEDYVIGGGGVVKALGICLRNRGNDSRSPSVDRTRDRSDGGTGSGRPRTPARGGKAKDMSKNLLASARRIRARLQPALVKESRAKDRSNYHRLLFLDQTLEGMINRFEAEYPETRIPSATMPPPVTDLAQETAPTDVHLSTSHIGQGSDTEPVAFEQPLSDDEGTIRPVLSRHSSEVSLASRALDVEEGHMHRFGQQFRRDIVKPDLETESHATPDQGQPRHLELLRAMMNGWGGEEIRSKIYQVDHDAVINGPGNEAAMLRQQLKEQDPEAWQKFVDSQRVAVRNLDVGSSPDNESAVE